MAAPHVVVFGIDGVRYDALCAARTPYLDGIGAAGFLSPLWVDEAAPSMSGPGWVTIATGVLAPRHGVYRNQLHGHRIDRYPDFLSRVRAAGLATYAASDWPPMLTPADGGPIFLGGGYCPVDVDPDVDPDAWANAEDLIAADAAAVLGGDDIAAAFVYLGAPDVVAHQFGVCPAYRESIELADSRIGLVLNAIRARPSYLDEEWTVLAVTDHGHLDEGGHGGDSAAERTAWLAACGPRIPTETPANVSHTDIHPHVLAALGIRADPESCLVGRPLGLQA